MSKSPKSKLFSNPFYVPAAHESLILIGAFSEKTLPQNNVKALIWNVYKGKDPRWESEFRDIIRGHDLVLLQEAVTDHRMPKIWREHFGKYAWNMAASFHLNPTEATGVVIGARAECFDLKFVRTKSRELFLLTPKIALISQFKIEGREDKLLVVNTHSLNFTTTSLFIKSVEEKIREIDAHKGPLIFAGDFNTWNTKRWILLVQMLSELKLYPVEFREDNRFFKLDHVFVRGINIHETHVLHGFKGSDHTPLEVVMSFE
ncbi:endonuclease/exonuclease/phosphatase family protein [Bdellovibrio sp. HCB337]|uniref:endonuclease/exonuclease/phosphatase family protein n=1 Tax=Bdellovibrio sp. HCB337 TaxID=3394358 RepID=UPI0039A5E92A